MFLDDATERALDDEPLRQSVARQGTVKEKLAAIVLWVKSTRLLRANSRYTIARGNLLAGGISYTSLISIFAVLVIGWTAFMTVLGGNEELRESVLDSINGVIPNLIGEGPDYPESNDPYLLDPNSLILDSPINVVSVITAGALVWSALALMGAFRMSVRQVFGIYAIPESFVYQKLRDAVGFILLALLVLVNSALGIAVNSVGHLVFDWLEITGTSQQVLLRLGTIVVGLAIDMLIFVLLIRVIAGARPLRKDLFVGAAIGSVASGVLRYAGTSLVSVPDNPVFSSIAVVGTLLIVVNLMARILLYVSAYVANPPAPVKPADPAEVHFNSRPNYVTVSVPETLEWDHQPATGSLIPDPSLGPNAPVPEPEPAPEPRWGGLIGGFQRRRLERMERKLDRARESYFK